MVQTITTRVHTEPDRLALVFIADTGSEEVVTVAELHADAIAAAHVLQANGITAGDVALLALPHSRALIAAFWGALYVGAVPSILPYVFASAETPIHRDHIHALATQAQARIVVTSPAFADQLGPRLSQVPCRVLGVEGNFTKDAAGIAPETWPDIWPPSDSRQSTEGTQLAYIQYTSGTTGMRKGVALCHNAIADWIQAFAHRLDIGQDDVGVNWLPLYHDFGLFAGLVMPVVCGMPTVLLSPFSVLRKPEALLWALHTHQGTLTWTTNTGYHLLTRRVRDQHLTGLDLSHVRAVVCGGEPIRHDSQQRFLDRFTPYGLRENVLVTGYGLAETTMGATVSYPHQRAPVDWIESSALQTQNQAIACQPDAFGAQSLVSCGAPLDGVEVQVVDAHEQPQAARQVGEVRVRGKTLFDGYYHQPEATAQVLREGWLYTGDLGYFVDEHLYICGRQTDLIIVGGRNIHPEEVEGVAEKAAGVVPGWVVAFGLDDAQLGTEHVVLVCGMDKPLTDEQQAQLEWDLRLRILRELDLPLADVRLVRRSWISVTTSGKVARAANRHKYLAAGWRPRSRQATQAKTPGEASPDALLQIVTTLFTEFLPAPGVDPHQNFSTLGLDSLSLVEFILLVEEEVGKLVPVEQLMENPTLARLAQLLSSPETPPPRSSQGVPATRLRLYLTQWRQQVERAGSPLRAVLQHGPSFRQAVLPYGIGSRLLRYLVQQPRLRQAVYGQEIALLQRCLHELSVPVAAEQVLQQSLVVNTWTAWREKALRHPATFGRWVTIQGGEIFERAAQEQRGVVLAFPHTSLRKVFRLYRMLHHGYERTIGNVGFQRLDDMGLSHLAETIRHGTVLSQQALRTAQFYHAQHELQRGRIVAVMADALAGQGGVLVDFHGRIRPIRPGIAELALRTAALLVPAFACIKPSGHITIAFCAPLVPEQGSHEVQVESLLRQYAELLSSWWSTQLGNMEWPFLQQFLRFPRVTG